MGTVRVITWSARVVGLIALASVVFPAGRVRLRGSVERWLDMPPEATLAAATIVLASGVLLLMLATGLRRRKRRAWQLALLTCALIALPHLLLWRGVGSGLTALALGVGLVVTRRHFTALPDPVGKWRGFIVLGQLMVAGFVINMLLLTVSPRRMVLTDDLWDRVEHVLLAFIGVTGPVRFGSVWLDYLVATVGVVFSIVGATLGGYFLLRSAEPAPGLSEVDDERLRGLIDTHGRSDSLAYFALRSDKSAVFSSTGKAAVSYRVLAGVALASGDPLGDLEAWPGAIDAFLDSCRTHGWVPAVLGCSERGATVWARYDLDVLELGDEAVVDAPTFTLDGRAMRGIRQAVAKLERAGYQVVVRRVSELDEAERAKLAGLAEEWRGTETERGFSMALSRPAGAHDPSCVVVTAEQAGAVRGMLQFVPWGEDGLSLDLMRRDREEGGNGLNELMIAELLRSCRALGVDRVSLNFAVFRAALERGQRIGAGPVARLWARALRLCSRWWQIESLYRFNAKFGPYWEPRYLVFSGVRDLPRIAMAALEAEGFGGRPPALLRRLRR